MAANTTNDRITAKSWKGMDVVSGQQNIEWIEARRKKAATKHEKQAVGLSIYFRALKRSGIYETENV